MTLFFFNFWDHNTYVVDPKGVELPNPNAVREQALKAARQIVDDGIAHGDDRSGWKFDIKNSSDRTSLTLPFAEAMLDQRVQMRMSTTRHSGNRSIEHGRASVRARA